MKKGYLDAERFSYKLYKHDVKEVIARCLGWSTPEKCIYDLYYKENLSFRKIAKIFRCGSTPIRNFIKINYKKVNPPGGPNNKHHYKKVKVNYNNINRSNHEK